MLKLEKFRFSLNNNIRSRQEFCVNHVAGVDVSARHPTFFSAQK